MAHKSKTQRAKASAARAARKEARIEEEAASTELTEAKVAEEPKKSRLPFKKSETAETPATTKAEEKPEKKPKKKKRFQFFRDVRAEMKRVTWPTKTDVLRWSGVVVAALIFFGIFVAILDNGVMVPILVAISSIGA